MSIGFLVFVMIQVAVFIYMIGIGYELFPDPGKSGSDKNKEHFDKFRKLFKIGGIAGIVSVILSLGQKLL